MSLFNNSWGKSFVGGSIMIGQTKLLGKIDKMLSTFPKFTIIVGAKGSGKKTIATHICNKLGLMMVNFGTGIDEVRNIIDLSYSQDKPICYFCPDADSMSIGAKNSLLKITEEPPQNAYFILTLQSINNTLETIQSRATVLALDNYTQDELLNYRAKRGYGGSFDSIIKDVCVSTGEVDELFKNDVPSFYKFANTIVNQIHIPTSGNIFKIPKSLKLSTNEKEVGFNPTLLFRTVRTLFLKKYIETKQPKYLLASNVTSECLRDLNIQTVSKLGTVDKWIMDVRRVLR